MYTKEELLNIIGGAFNGTIINAFVRVINSFLEVGRSLGTAIRRITSGAKCKI